jgi:hypothetical protein
MGYCQRTSIIGCWSNILSVCSGGTAVRASPSRWVSYRMLDVQFVRSRDANRCIPEIRLEPPAPIHCVIGIRFDRWLVYWCFSWRAPIRPRFPPRTRRDPPHELRRTCTKRNIKGSLISPPSSLNQCLALVDGREGVGKMWGENELCLDR